MQYLPLKLFENYLEKKEEVEKKKFLNQLSKEMNIIEKDIFSQIRFHLYKIFFDEKDKKQSVSLDNFSKRLFDNRDKDKRAAKGLLCFLYDYHEKIKLAFRFHLFFKNIEGLWSCADPKCSKGYQEENQNPLGQIYLNKPTLNCGKQHRVFETLCCEQCGTLFLGGIRKTDEYNKLELLQTTSNIEKIPDEHITPFFEKRSYKDYAIFWPCPKGQSINIDVKDKKWKQPSLTSSINNNEAQWLLKYLNIKKGTIEEDENEKNTVKGYLFDIQKPSENTMALSSVCPSCGIQYNKHMKTPIRGFRTGFSKMIQILSKELFYQLDEENKKLIVFSDSREEAARTSNGIERSHYQDLIREILYNELRLIVKGEPEFLEDLEQYQEAKSDMAKKYESQHPGHFEKLKKYIDCIQFCEKQSDLIDELKDNKDKYQKEIDRIKRMKETQILPINILFEDNTEETLLLRLKNMGVNPAGNSFRQTLWIQKIIKEHSWYDLFNSSKYQVWNDGVSQTLKEKRGEF